MKHKSIMTAAISAVLGLMSLALSAKESYIGSDSTVVVRDYIDMTGESPRYMFRSQRIHHGPV